MLRTGVGNYSDQVLPANSGLRLVVVDTQTDRRAWGKEASKGVTKRQQKGRKDFNQKSRRSSSIVRRVESYNYLYK